MPQRTTMKLDGTFAAQMPNAERVFREAMELTGADDVRGLMALGCAVRQPNSLSDSEVKFGLAVLKLKEGEITRAIDGWLTELERQGASWDIGFLGDLFAVWIGLTGLIEHVVSPDLRNRAKQFDAAVVANPWMREFMSRVGRVSQNSKTK